MVRAISEDLRSRVIAAVEGGLSRRAAADRFGVAVASAVRWVREWRESGATRAKPQGGDKRSQRIEAYRDTILAAIEGQDDITLVELAEFLKAEHAVVFAPGSRPSLISIPNGWSLSTRPARRRRWLACVGGKAGQAVPVSDPARALENDHFYRRIAPDGHDGADGP